MGICSVALEWHRIPFNNLWVISQELSSMIWKPPWSSQHSRVTYPGLSFPVLNPAGRCTPFTCYWYRCVYIYTHTYTCVHMYIYIYTHKILLNLIQYTLFICSYICSKKLNVKSCRVFNAFCWTHENTVTLLIVFLQYVSQ